MQRKDWWDVTAQGQLRTFRGQPPNPYKPQKYAPFRCICASPNLIQPDFMHSYNLGFGKDLAASGVVLVVMQGLFAGNNFQSKLDAAFVEFKLWCEENAVTSSLKSFDMTRTLKMTSQLGCLMDR